LTAVVPPLTSQMSRRFTRQSVSPTPPPRFLETPPFTTGTAIDLSRSYTSPEVPDIVHLVSHYGYALLVVLVGLESFGIPLPGETALVTAGALAARGHLNIFAVIVAAAAGAIIGDNGGYWLGRKGGIALVRRFGRKVGLTETKLLRVHEFFDKHGAKTVFIGRFIALLRSWAAALAGVGEMPYGLFSMYNALGGIAWATVFGVLGYIFGHNMPLLERYIARFSIGLLVLVAAGAAFFIWRRRRVAATST